MPSKSNRDCDRISKTTKPHYFNLSIKVSSVNGVANSNGEAKKDDISLRPDTTRRVGSGRILARDRDIDDLERDK